MKRKVNHNFNYLRTKSILGGVLNLFSVVRLTFKHSL